MNTEEKAQELYPNNKTFCGGVAQIARDAFAKGARMQKEADDKELSEKVSAAYQLGLSDREKQIMKEVVEGEITTDNRGNNVLRAGVLNNGFEIGDRVKIIFIKEEENGQSD